jgi:inner membrane protein
MTAPNHIIGGIAITGISLSFWDINIFSNSLYLSFCIFSSLLPDIDHTKSMIGKVFYPIAKYLDVKFGHRTITHSITILIPLFIFFCFFELNIINPYFDRNGIDFSLIFLFAFLSHLILDMLTIQGIPLFYPFLKNPCVIPANPNMRFRSGNMKSEAIALFIFSFVLFSSYDLFKNGFWTTYNRSFGTVKHAFREFRDSENIIVVIYDYSFNGIKKTGTGYIIDADETHLEIYSRTNAFHEGRITIIDNKDNRTKNISVQPMQTKHKYSVIDFKFFNLTLQKLNDTLDNKIVSGKILSSDKFIVNKYKALKASIELNKEISPKFKWIKNDTLKTKLTNQLEIKRAKLHELQNDNYIERDKLQGLKNQLLQYRLDLKNSKNIYTKNKAEKDIIQQKNDLKKFKLKLKNTDIIEKEISILKRELNYKTEHFFTGDLKIFTVPKNDDNFEVANN